MTETVTYSQTVAALEAEALRQRNLRDTQPPETENWEHYQQAAIDASSAAIALLRAMPTLIVYDRDIAAAAHAAAVEHTAADKANTNLWAWVRRTCATGAITVLAGLSFGLWQSTALGVACLLASAALLYRGYSGREDRYLEAYRLSAEHEHLVTERQRYLDQGQTSPANAG